MLNDIAIEAFNTRSTVNVNNIKTMTVSELDRIKTHGMEAEALMRNRSLVLFIHQSKFDISDQLAAILGHSEEDNNRRIALSNQLAGLEKFVDTLKQAVYYRNLVVKQQNAPADVNP